MPQICFIRPLTFPSPTMLPKDVVKLLHDTIEGSAEFRNRDQGVLDAVVVLQTLHEVMDEGSAEQLANLRRMALDGRTKP